VSAQLIDKDGVCWDRDSGQLQGRFGANCSTTTFESFLVRNLGFVSIHRNQSSCVVKVAPAQLTAKAFFALSQQLGQAGSARHAVSLFEDCWQHLIFPDYRSVLDHLIRTSARCRNGVTSESFGACARALSTLPRDHPLADLLDAWRTSSGGLDVAACARLLNERLGGRFALIEREETTSDLVFSRIGHGFAMYDPGWPERMVGYPIECQPDATYGRWVARSLCAVFDRTEPTLHDVNAVVTNPLARSSRRVRYTRLTLPVHDRRGVKRMLSASFVDAGVDLGIEAS